MLHINHQKDKEKYKYAESTDKYRYIPQQQDFLPTNQIKCCGASSFALVLLCDLKLISEKLRQLQNKVKHTQRVQSTVKSSTPRGPKAS